VDIKQDDFQLNFWNKLLIQFIAFTLKDGEKILRDKMECNLKKIKEDLREYSTR